MISGDSDVTTGEALEDLQANILRKQNALKVLDLEYNKLCLNVESNMNYIEELASKMHNLESYHKSIECRLEEYDKKQVDWEKEANNLQLSLENLERSFKEEELCILEDDNEFEKTLLKLLEEIHHDREWFNNNSSVKQIEKLLNSNNRIKEEIRDIQLTLMKLKKEELFVPSEVICVISRNSNLRCCIESEIQNLEKIKNEKMEAFAKIKTAVVELEKEIEKMSIS